MYRPHAKQEKSDFSYINSCIEVPQNLNSTVEDSLSQDVNLLPSKENVTGIYLYWRITLTHLFHLLRCFN